MSEYFGKMCYDRVVCLAGIVGGAAFYAVVFKNDSINGGNNDGSGTKSKRIYMYDGASGRM